MGNTQNFNTNAHAAHRWYDPSPLRLVWPPSFSKNEILEGSFSFMAGVSLGPHWQNIPGNILGFVLSLYTFRLISTKYESRFEDKLIVGIFIAVSSLLILTIVVLMLYYLLGINRASVF